MEAFNKYKAQLKEFQYPNINAFNDEQVQDIFSPKNRCFLLTWLIKNLNSQVIDLDSSKLSETAIGDYLSESGFCTLSQKQQFVQGTYNINEQIKIFDRIFEYMGKITYTKNVKNLSSSMETEEIDNFLRRDINLFPHFGSIKVYTPKERQDKLRAYKEDIDILHKKISANLDKSSEVTNLKDLLLVDDNEYVENFKQFATDLRGALSLIRESKNHNTEEEAFQFKQNFVDDLQRCCTEMEPVLQYFKNIHMRHEIEQDTKENTHKSDSDFPVPLKPHVDSFSNILELLKNNLK